jgi:glycosyltransferase involved in cell wall biosynthesis
MTHCGPDASYTCGTSATQTDSLPKTIKMPKVSVIIPTCDRAEYLGVAITSVLNQTFQDFELIVVDDASIDSASDVVRSFHDDRVKFIRHETRKGGSAARNTGIVNSKCDYLAFLDDDDEWYPEKLARQMAVMLKSQPQVAVVYTGYVLVHRSSGNIVSRMVPTQRGDLYHKLLESNPIGGTSSVMLKRTCLEKVGLFDESLPSFQDRDLWIRISREFQFDYVQEPLLNYFVHPQKVWTNLEALTKGLEIMLRKYGSSPAFRKQCSSRYLEFGVCFCEARQIQNGRRALLRSIGLYPYGIKPYLNFFLTLLGLKVFTMAHENKAKIFGRLGLPGF